MANYDGVAEHIRHGELSASDAFYPIGYPAFLGSVYALTDRNFTVVAILQALLGAATCGLVAMLTVRLSPSTAASLAAATAVTVYPPFIYYSAMLLTESVAPFWFTLSVWLFLRAIEAPTIRRHAFAGVTLAVATVIRPNVLVLYPFIVMVTVHAHKPNRSRGLRTAAQIVGFAAPLLLGVAVLNSTLTGRITGLSTNGGVNFFLLQRDIGQLNYEGNWLAPVRNTQFSEAVSSPVSFSSESYFYREGIRAFVRRPDKIRHVANNVSEGFGLGFQAYWPANQFLDIDDRKTNALERRLLRWCSRAFFWLLVLPIAIEIFRQARNGRLWQPSGAPILLALSIIAGILVTSAVFLADPRMHVPFDGVLMSFSASAVVGFGALVRDWIGRRRAR
jgi:4-amino-4-deoxy-L-arabinose transferase-like glycosyltransferase